MSNERNVRARREDATLSVRAETVFVADPKISTDGIRKRSILTPNGDVDAGICLNKKATITLFLLIAILSTFSLATSVYIIYDIYLTR
jgi:hypothetical protein